MAPEIKAFYEERTATVSYVLSDPTSGQAAIIDPVLNYCPRSGRTTTVCADEILAHVEQQGLQVGWLLETHPHADHLSATGYLKQRLVGKTGIGSGVCAVQRTWTGIYDLGAEVATDGSQFDRLFDDGETFTIGELRVTVWHVPGHTPACVAYLLEGVAFVGDTLFMPDYGTARADFPGGDARALYRSIRRLLSLPPETRLFTCHDYAPGGRAVAWESTVAQQRAENKHVHDGVSEDDFVAMRESRDRELDLPELLLPSLQVNIRGGCLPEPESNGTAYLKIPLNRF